MREVNTHYQK